MNSLCYVVGKNGYKRKQINGKLNVDHSKQIPVYAVVHQYMNLNDREKYIIPPIKEEQLREQAQDKEQKDQTQNDPEYLKQIRYLPLDSNIKNDKIETYQAENQFNLANDRLNTHNQFINGVQKNPKIPTDSNQLNQQNSVYSYSSRDHLQKDLHLNGFNNIKAIDFQSNVLAKSSHLPNRDSNSTEQINHQTSITHIDFTQVQHSRMGGSQLSSITNSANRNFDQKTNKELNRDLSASFTDNRNKYRDMSEVSNPNQKLINRSESEIISTKYPKQINRQLNKDTSITYIDHYSFQDPHYTTMDSHLRRQPIYRSEFFDKTQKNSQRQRNINQENFIHNKDHPYSSLYNKNNISQSHIQNENNQTKIHIGTSKMMDKTQVDSISNRQYPSVKELSLRDTSISHIETYTNKKPIKNSQSHRNSLNAAKNYYSSQQQILRLQLQRQKVLRKQLQNEFIKLTKEKELKQIDEVQDKHQNNYQINRFNYKGFITVPIKKLKKQKITFNQITQSDQLISQNDIKEKHFVINHKNSNISLNPYEQNSSNTDQNDKQHIQGSNRLRLKDYYESQKYFQSNLIQYLTELNEKIDNLEERLKKKVLKTEKNRYQQFLQQKLNKSYHYTIQSNNKIVQLKEKSLTLKQHMHYIFTIFMLSIIIILILKDKSK